MDMSPTMAKYLDPGTLVGHGNTYLKASFQMNAGIKYDAIGTGNELTYDRNAASLFAAPFGEEAEAPTSRSDMAEGDSIFADGYVHSGSSSVGGSVWSGASSFDSLLSGGSSSSIHSRISRKGRRQWKTSRIRKAAIRRNKQSTNAQGNAMPRFTCTFCSPYQHFNSRYAWNRHEEAIHVPRSLWVCNGVDSASGLKGPCFYCTYPHDSLDQMSRHNHLLCVEKPEATRTFTRRDGLVQHLHTAHKGIDLAHMDDLIQRWQRKLPPLDPGNPILVCSFCCFVSPDWESRVNHVGNHFKEPWMQCFDWSRSESSPLRQLYSLAKAAFQNGQMTDEPVQPVAHTAIADLKPPSFKPATILKELLLRLDSWAHVPKEFTQSQRIKFNDFMVSQLTDESLDSPAMELERHIESQFKLKNYDWYGAKRRETTRSILRQLGPLRLSDILQDNMLLPDYWTLVALHRLLAPAPLRFQHHSY
jgi:hypothetical protein